VATSLTPFPYRLSTVTGISPLTYRDAETFLEELESLKHWLTTVNIPEVETILTGILADAQTGVENAEATVTEAKQGWDTLFTDFMVNVVANIGVINNAVIDGRITAGIVGKLNIADAATTYETKVDAATALDLVEAEIKDAPARVLADKSAALRTWYGAVGMRETTPADAVVIGDSVAEGYWADRFGARWIDVLTRTLRANLPGPDASVYYPAMGGRIVNTGTTVYSGGGGPGVVHTEGSLSTLSATATGFDVNYVQGVSGVGTMWISIDGAPAATVNTVGPQDAVGSYKVRGLLPGTHTVTVSMAEGSPAPVILKEIRAYRSGRIPGGSGYHPAYHAAGAFPGQPLSVSGNPVQGAVNGLGYRTVNLVSGTQALTLTDEMTGATIFYTQKADSDPFLVNVDGGAFVNVNTTGAIGATGIYQVRNLEPGIHTIIVKGNGVANGAEIQGIMSYNMDENAGIRVWDASHSGGASADFVSSKGTHKPLQVIQPDLAIIALGINDSETVPIATYKTNILSAIQGVRNNTDIPPSIVLMAYPEPNRVNTSIPWADYVQQLRDIANTDPDVTLFDLQARMNPGAPAELNGMFRPDKTHPLNKGMGFIGDSLAGFLIPA